MVGDLFGLGKFSDNSLELMKTIYPDLAQPSVKKVGLALETVFDLANTILLPLKLVNEKAKYIFEKRMKDYQEKLDAYPESQIGAVPPEIGLPILDELSRTTNDELAALFTNLLVNASLVEKCRYAHPSFINIIKSISVDEARIINYFLTSIEPIIAVSFFKENRSKELIAVADKIFLNLNENVELLFKENSIIYFTNLIRIGIIDGAPGCPTNMKHVYESKRTIIDERRSTLQKEVLHPDDIGEIYEVSNEITTHHFLTAFGKEFVASISV